MALEAFPTLLRTPEASSGIMKFPTVAPAGSSPFEESLEEEQVPGAAYDSYDSCLAFGQQDDVVQLSPSYPPAAVPASLLLAELED